MSQTASPTEAVSPDGGGPLTLAGMLEDVTVTSFPGLATIVFSLSSPRILISVSCPKGCILKVFLMPKLVFKEQTVWMHRTVAVGGS